MGQQIHGPAERSGPPSQAEGVLVPGAKSSRRVRPRYKRNPVRISTGIRILDDPRGVRAAGVVAKLDAVRAETQQLQSHYQRKLAALDELTKSLLYQAFSGEL